MSERFRISCLAIEGFRGINNKLEIDLDGKPAIFFGPNGVGKSSIMEAVEWCLFGGLISAIVGPAEFKKEDAIVNSFHPKKKATVEMTLKGDKTVSVTRERKLGKSSVSGKTELKVEIDNNQFSGDEAQIELNKLLRMTPAEFYASAYLHQEAIRDLIVGDPVLKSEVIDKLLGLHFVRELIDYLPLKHVSKEAKSVEEEVRDIKERKMVEVVIARGRLGELEGEIEEFAIVKADLNPTSLIMHTQEVSNIVKTIAEKMNTEIEDLENPTSDLRSLEKGTIHLKKTIDGLEKNWGAVYKESVKETSNLKTMKQSYEEAIRELASMETQDPKDLSAKKSEISDQISMMEKNLDQGIKDRIILQEKSALVHRLYSDFEEARIELEKLTNEFGNETEISEKVNKQISQIDEKVNAAKKEEALGSVLVSGLDYLRTALPQKCPICTGDIVYQNVVSILEKEISERESAKIVRELQKELDQLRENKARTQNALDNLHKFTGDLRGAQSKIEEQREKLKQNGFEPGEANLMDYIDGELGRLNSQIASLDDAIRKLKSQETQEELKLKDLQKKLEKLSYVEKQVQKLTATAETGEKLVNQLFERINSLDQNTATLEGITEDIRVSKSRLEICEKILNFLKEKERVTKLEEGLPALQLRLKDLEEKYSKLKELETGLTDIYNVTSTAREEMVKKALLELQSVIGSFYSKMLAHPYYVNLQLIPEEERGKAIYRIRAWDKDFKQGTFVATRFSNAQMNAVALSIFLSMSIKLQSNLGLILLDDPTQSMDPEHKEALSRLLNEIFDQRQILVATQDAEFEECMKKSMPEDKTRIYKIQQWDTEGPKIS